MDEHKKREIAIKTQYRIQDIVPQVLRQLLEEKHLYQSVKIDDYCSSYQVEQDTEAEVIDETKRYCNFWINHASWYLYDQKNPTKYSYMEDHSIVAKFTHAKMFCKRCMGREAYNYIKSEILFHSADPMPTAQPVDRTQIYSIALECQSCRNAHEVVLIRRDGRKLTLSGRSPMEHIAVPDYIPKTVRGYYGDALLAFQSGQLLPGNFMLRTLIEQWAYSMSSNAKTAEEALDQYMAILPQDFKERFPSIREMYSTLSDDIHKAEGSYELFERVKANIQKHFRGYQLFELPNEAVKEEKD